VRVLEAGRRRLEKLRPRTGTAYLTYISIHQKLETAGKGEGVATGEGAEYRFHEITSPDDPALAFAPRWQRRLCRVHMPTGAWYCLVAYEAATGKKVGHVWSTTVSQNGLLNGMVNVKLHPDEVYVWDLYIDPSHRQLGLSQAMGWALIRSYAAREKRYGLTHVLYENAPSILWHHMFGFSWLQLFNYVQIGDRICVKVPFSACPAFGPLSRRGRHSLPDSPDPFGGALLPSDGTVTRDQIRSLRQRAKG
jgi:ribosomal protein S18 acetylase RimI-like enzyme